MTFLDVWIVYAIIGTMVFCAAFAWAVRARQFTDLDRAGHIPLGSDRLPEAEPSETRPSRPDGYAWVLLVLVAAALLTCAIWIGIRSG